MASSYSNSSGAALSPASIHPLSCLKKPSKATSPQHGTEFCADGEEWPLPTPGHTLSPGSYASQLVLRISQIIHQFGETKPRPRGQVEDRSINPGSLPQLQNVSPTRADGHRLMERTRTLALMGPSSARLPVMQTPTNDPPDKPRQPAFSVCPTLRVPTTPRTVSQAAGGWWGGRSAEEGVRKCSYKYKHFAPRRAPPVRSLLSRYSHESTVH